MSVHDDLQRAHQAIVDFCDHGPSLCDPDPSTRQSLMALIRIANEVRPKGKLCGHQNEEYPEERCVRRPHRTGRHEGHGGGCSWG